jgi:hypothetical protein
MTTLALVDLKTGVLLVAEALTVAGLLGGARLRALRYRRRIERAESKAQLRLDCERGARGREAAMRYRGGVVR